PAADCCGNSVYQRRRALMADRFAAISDVHGNRWALEAVLADLARRDITSIVNLGDHLFGPLDPDGTAELLIPSGMPMVMGNQDRELLEPGCAQPTTSAQREWLAAMPARIELPGMLLFHGTPQSDLQYLMETVHPGGVSLASESEIRARLGAEELPALLLCGHTHVPRIATSGGHLIVNPGSVGLQAYAEDDHVMETGSPQARYAILERAGGSWDVLQIQIRYDWEAAAVAATQNGRPDWAYRLRTGRAR
ncbi:MAG TPA: metallophosphoesterase family protein, partial [Bryobacteraceae bacterium]|nr:metallophosphoesterase family protein [Bryobacteraceae bacterium]